MEEMTLQSNVQGFGVIFILSASCAELHNLPEGNICHLIGISQQLKFAGHDSLPKHNVLAFSLFLSPQMYPM